MMSTKTFKLEVSKLEASGDTQPMSFIGGPDNSYGVILSPFLGSSSVVGAPLNCNISLVFKNSCTCP